MCRHVRLRVVLMLFASLAIVPAAAYAQASITGVVRDTSGGVLPGVTVEAASPALIEKVRSVVTDVTGQYRLENLRPGSYTVTFTLSGFAIVRREGIQLTGTFVATVNAELPVGALEETITVTGESPTVDVQSTTRQRVLDQEIIDALPTARIPQQMAALIPGVTSSTQDVGGLIGEGPARGSTLLHGVSDTRIRVSGLSLHTAGSGEQGAPNPGVFQEIAVDTAGISVEYLEGGVNINMVPREGGNTPRGYFLGGFANRSMQGNNFTRDLQDRGLGTPDSLKKLWDLNPAFGGPIIRDTLWFHATGRYSGALSFVPVFFNKHAGNPNVWTYEPDISRDPAWTENTWKTANARITWQATSRNKVSFAHDEMASCDCPRTLSTRTAPEASAGLYANVKPKRMVGGDWMAPVTNRLLFEATVLRHVSRSFRMGRPVGRLGAELSGVGENPYFVHDPGPVKLNSVTEQSTGLTYRATREGTDSWNRNFFSRIAMSYVTGSHAFKVGFAYANGSQDEIRGSVDSPMTFRFNNGVPNRLTVSALPHLNKVRINPEFGLFVQDKWTVHRMTLTVGLRYDHVHSFFPETTLGPVEFVPARNIVLPKTDGVRWHDISPRSGLAFDLFGDGRTALKVSLGKYLAPQPLSSAFTRDLSPTERINRTTNRSWNDANRNFVPDCDLLNPAANGECGGMDNPDFGTPAAGRTYDPKTLRGWGKRGYNSQFSAGVQRELMPRISLDVSYFRTWFGNLFVAGNHAVGPSDYDAFSITAPVDPRLPSGGGYVISGLYDLNPAKFGVPVDNFLTFADNYGKQIEHWNGVEVTLNARPRPGLMLQGGTSTGRRTTDNCAVLAQLPELDPVGRPYCRQQEKFRTQVKFLGTYTVPRIDVQVSGTLQNLPGPQILANYVASNAEVAPSLGRNLAGGARNVTVNLVAPGTMYGERMNQLDLRISKILRFGRTRTTASLDLYNAFNSSAVLRHSDAFATWQRPENILKARFAKVVLQLDF